MTIALHIQLWKAMVAIGRPVYMCELVEHTGWHREQVKGVLAYMRKHGDVLISGANHKDTKYRVKNPSVKPERRPGRPLGCLDKKPRAAPKKGKPVYVPSPPTLPPDKWAKDERLEHWWGIGVQLNFKVLRIDEHRLFSVVRAGLTRPKETHCTKHPAIPLPNG